MGSNYISLNEFRKDPKAYTVSQIRDQICSRQRLSKKFMREMADYLSWDAISMYQKLDEDFIEEMADKVHWTTIWGNQHLTEHFVRKHLDIVNWFEISFNYKVQLSQKFIVEYLDKLDIATLIYHHWDIQNEEMYRVFLSDEMYNDKIRHAVSHNPPSHLSKDFVREFRDKITFDYKITQRFSRDEKFFEEFYDHIGFIGWEHNSFNNNSHTFDFLIRFQDDLNWHGIRPYLERNITPEQRDILMEIQKRSTM